MSFEHPLGILAASKLLLAIKEALRARCTFWLLDTIIKFL